MLDKARELQRQRQLENVSWQLGRADSLPYPDASFDAVVTRFAFHHLATPAAALAEIRIEPPTVPVVANVLVKPIRDPGEIVRALVAQVTGTVRWRESVALMAREGVTTFCEVGAGKVLSGLIKRVAEGARGLSIGTPDDIAAFKSAVA